MNLHTSTASFRNVFRKSVPPDAARVLPFDTSEITPFAEGDVVRDGWDCLCRIEQLGFLNVCSPYPEDVEFGLWRAYVSGFTTDGAQWADWALLDDLSLADRYGKRRFEAFEAQQEAAHSL